MQATIARRGMMLVLSSPSGAGKTTLARRLLQRDAGITMSVSVTTRSRRPGEVDGVDYHFLTRLTTGKNNTKKFVKPLRSMWPRCLHSPKLMVALS